MSKKVTTKLSNICQICTKSAVGYHYGAYVCEACKKFFLRHSSDVCRLYGTCQENGHCNLAINGRGKCQHCRLQRCRDMGMSMSHKSSDYDLSVIPCQVCGAKSSGLHFGCITCEGCKGFFRRMIKCNSRLVCVNNNKCELSSNTRSSCKRCRLERCINIGMSRNGIRIGRHPNAMKFDCLNSMKSNKTFTDIFDHSPCDSKSQTSSIDNEKGALSETENIIDDKPDNKSTEDTNVDMTDEKMDNLEYAKTTDNDGLLIEEDNDVEVLIDICIDSKDDYDHIEFDEEFHNSECNLEEGNVISTSFIDLTQDNENIDEGLLLELEEHITQIVNNVSPSLTFLTQKESNAIHEKKNEILKSDSRQAIWSIMMDHFVLHSKFIVKLAKLIPGFSKLSIPDKKAVIKDSMYPMMLLELSQDYVQINDEVFFNYFDFNSSDRETILAFFPEFVDFSNHLKKCGAVKHLLNLNAVEITLICGIIMFYNYRKFSDSNFGRSMMFLYQDFLMVYFESKLGYRTSEAEDRQRICLEFISLLDDMNNLHHKIITDFCIRHNEIQYPDLYIEIFNN